MSEYGVRIDISVSSNDMGVVRALDIKEAARNTAYLLPDAIRQRVMIVHSWRTD